MKKTLTFIFLMLALRAAASHIVGGEFQMIHLSGYHYRINLLIYYDDRRINGPLPSAEPEITASIFRYSDDAKIRDVVLTAGPQATRLSYLRYLCATDLLLTNRLEYSIDEILEPEFFSDPAGYYIVWERCCRNYEITNIHSDDPNFGPQPAGLTFFLQFPPVIKDGVPFVNDSPQLLEPFADVACINTPFYTNFAATDEDGDSLVYSITEPLSTHTFDALPPTVSAPYPKVVWRSPYNSQNVMGGNPDLAIRSDGYITVTPTASGMFVFAVKCEEYRNGVKIGVVRREFTLIVAECEPNIAPAISAKALSGSYSDSTLDVHFDNAVTDSERCITVKVTDENSNSSSSFVKIRAIPLGVPGDVSEVLPAATGVTLSSAQHFGEFSICFDRCPPLGAPNTFRVGIIAFDHPCGTLADTVIINVSLEVPPGVCQPQSIDFPPIADKTFGDDSFSLNAIASSGLPVTYSAHGVVTVESSSTVVINNPGQAVVKAMQAGDATYRMAASVERRFCINPRAPLLTLEDDGNSYIIVSSSTIGNVWYRDGVIWPEVTGQTAVQVAGALTARYTARVVIDNCVSEESTPIFVTITDVDSPTVEKEFQIFPNPASDIVTIDLSGSERTDEIELQDINGRRLIRTSGETQFINIEGFKAGVYVLKIKHGNRFHVWKIFKK